MKISRRPLRCFTRGLCAIVLAARVAAQSPTPPAATTPLLRAIKKAASSLPAGGFVLAEVAEGHVTFASAGRPAPRDGIAPEKIIFEIGSITKVFTALLLAQTVLEGKAALSDPIAKHLPRELALDPETAAITLGQLATHTSGLPRLPDNLKPAAPADPYADYSVPRLHDFLRAHRPVKPAPQPADYSNLGFGLLGHLLERIHGQSYATLIATRISGPLGLSDTTVDLSDEQRGRFAKPFSGSTAVPPWRFDCLAGAGALRSTTADLARFAQALLSGGNASLQAAWNLVREPRAPFGASNVQIGLAVLIMKRGEDVVYLHDGGTGGFRAHLELTPARQRATLLLLNNDAPDPAAKDRAETPIDAARLKDYPGVYAIDARSRFTVVLDDTGRLRAQLTGQGLLPVLHSGGDRFFARAVAAEFQFHRDATGAIASLTLHQNGRDQRAPRLPAAPKP
jgi:CubicO group peptidase (beta-lactamase class C family)